MRDVYSKEWPNGRAQYGFTDYDKNMCQLICENVPERSKLLEVAAGTGDPFADYFQKHGYDVYGLDIAPNLIDLCQRLNPEIKCEVGDAENLPFQEGYFDCVYCLHSTWYFSDLRRAICEMIRTTRDGGFIIFDIMNRHHKLIKRSYHRNLFLKTTFFGKSLIALHRGVIKKRGAIWQDFVVHETPTYPEQVYAYLSQTEISSYNVLVVDANSSLLQCDELDELERFARVVFVLRK